MPGQREYVMMLIPSQRFCQVGEYRICGVSIQGYVDIIQKWALMGFSVSRSTYYSFCGHVSFIEVETERKTGLSMVQRTVLKVDISCDKCKKKILKAVSSLPGVDKIEIDGDKGTLTVTGEADPYEIIMRTKKSGKFVQVMSIGPPPASPKKPNEKKPEEKKPEIKGHVAHAYIHNPHNCHVCAQMPVVQMVRFNEPNPSCAIM